MVLVVCGVWGAVYFVLGVRCVLYCLLCVVCNSVNGMEETDTAHRNPLCMGVGGSEIRLAASSVVSLPIGLIAHDGE